MLESQFEVTHLYCEGLRLEAARDFQQAAAPESTSPTGAGFPAPPRARCHDCQIVSRHNGQIVCLLLCGASIALC